MQDPKETGKLTGLSYRRLAFYHPCPECKDHYCTIWLSDCNKEDLSPLRCHNCTKSFFFLIFSPKMSYFPATPCTVLNPKNKQPEDGFQQSCPHCDAIGIAYKKDCEDNKLNVFTCTNGACKKQFLTLTRNEDEPSQQVKICAACSANVFPGKIFCPKCHKKV